MSFWPSDSGSQRHFALAHNFVDAPDPTIANILAGFDSVVVRLGA